ncbi:unnamed protein product [Callosobruchus maculatus]|uniref:Uncharacterized protein n=1 Tax=Callosobruchus maculatus TaxID=64391 RepID=A0A653C153_CALMS|nr:unnamed protein product [Callosobruchus maculatus]
MRADKTSKCFLRKTHVIGNSDSSSILLDQKQGVVIAISVKQRRLIGQNCKHIINGAKHLHRYLETQAYPP